MIRRCAICDVELTENDRQDHNAYWPHCNEHKNHASYGQLWVLKKELNLPFNGTHLQEPKKEDQICAVCGLPLTEEELLKTKSKDWNLVCRFHKRKAGDINIQRTREELGYDAFLYSKPIDIMIQQWKL